MKFLWAIIVYLLMGAVLGCGILQAVRGNLWLLIAAVIAYVVLFSKLGCLPKKSH
jgi:hypothetical protein